MKEMLLYMIDDQVMISFVLSTAPDQAQPEVCSLMPSPGAAD